MEFNSIEETIIKKQSLLQFVNSDSEKFSSQFRI